MTRPFNFANSRRVRSAAAMAASALLLGGCLAGNPLKVTFGPNDPVTIAGELRGNDGSLTSGQTISLLDSNEKQLKQTTTDSGGKYSFVVTGAEATTTDNTARTLTLKAAGPDGSYLQQDVYPLKVRNDAKPMRFWSGLAGLTEGATVGTSLDFEIKPPAAATQRTYFSVETGKVSNWLQEEPKGQIKFPTYRLLNDKTYTLTLQADFDGYTAGVKHLFKTGADTAAQVLKVDSATDENGKTYPAFIDGDFSHPDPTNAGAQLSGPVSRELILDLGASKAVGRLVGIDTFANGDQVFVAETKGAWGDPVATVGESEYWDVDLQGKHGRYVRLYAPTKTPPPQRAGSPAISVMPNVWFGDELRVIAP